MHATRASACTADLHLSSREIERFIADAASDEQTVIYLSGHGFAPPDSEEDRAFFAGVDCTLTNKACLSLSTVKDQLADALANPRGPRHIVLIVDACFAGRAVVAKGWNVELGAAAQRAVEVVAAGTRDELALEDPTAKLSYFTEFLVRGLKGDADMLPDGYITLSELVVWVRYHVATATGRKQTPSFTRIKGAGDMMFKAKAP